MTAGRLKIWNADANAWEYPPGGSGGSQTVEVLGPFHLDYTQFATEDATVTLFTPAAGKVLIKGFGDGLSAVPFNDGGSIDFAIGEDPPGPSFNDSIGFWAFLGNSVGPSFGVGVFPDTDSADNVFHPGTSTGTVVFTGGPVKIRATSVTGDGTAGEMDLYFVVATPTAP